MRLLRCAPLIAFAGLGCARAPSPLAPHYEGSIGLPHHGVLTQPSELPPHGEGFKRLTSNDRPYGTPRLVSAIERAAAKVARERPGSVLVVGDLSAKTGGKISHHSSHRTGRDVDLLLYVTTLEGAPVESPGFVSIGADGLAWDERGQRFLRLDLEREWLLVKTLVEDPEARTQWLFVSRPVEAMLVEWARARGEPAETIVRAMDVMLQPGPPAQPHDDHLHLRSACDPEGLGAGCEPSGPDRPGIVAFDADRAKVEPEIATTDLLLAILRPISRDAGSFASDVPKARR